ncbi:MAG: hypothetical protein J7K21_07590, partial [Desulfurococcales archaeon]|nr:hypothetical protein [Desulfurococcales archaeon]
MGLGRAATCIAFTALCFFLVSIPISQAYSLDSVVVYVLADGSAKVVYTISISSPPERVSLKLFGSPLYIEAYSDDTVVPVDIVDDTVEATGLGENLTIKYYTLDLTSKSGDTWILNLETPYHVTIVLPENALVYRIEPENFTVTLVDGEPGFSFNPGSITIEYI